MPKLKVERLSNLDFTIQCVSCGETKDIQMWPHRNLEGKMVGFLFFCAKCSGVAPGVICKFEYPQKKTLNFNLLERNSERHNSMASMKRRIQEAFQNDSMVYLVWARNSDIRDVSVLPGKLVRISETTHEGTTKTDYIVKAVIGDGLAIDTTTLMAYVLCLTHEAAGKAVKMLLGQLEDGKGVLRP